MKGFLALALAAAPSFAAEPLKRPVHLAFSYDEEVGCLGAPDLIRAIAASVAKPSAVIVGEPTNMQVVSAHKSITTFKVIVVGHEAHSSQPHLGASANMAAVRLMAHLDALAEQFRTNVASPSLFTPAETTLTIGTIKGGTAGNILAGGCEFVFDIRCAPEIEPSTLLEGFFTEAEAMNTALRDRFPEAGVEVIKNSFTPGLQAERDGPAERLARCLAGDNGPRRAVSYAAEAGQFQDAGYSTVICGPGSIDQAHQADEYLELSQLHRGAISMARLVEALCLD